MDTDIKKDLNITVDLLETLVNLRITPIMDKVLIDPQTGECRVYYVDGVYISHTDYFAMRGILDGNS